MPLRIDVTREARCEGLGPDPDGLVERAARAVLEDRGVADAELSIALLDDPAMARLNREWKGRDAPTDVLAFALHDAGESPIGDLYIGCERALDQANELAEPVARELARLAIHGTLHVLGFDHPESERETSEMWRHQERILDGVVAA